MNKSFTKGKRNPNRERNSRDTKKFATTANASSKEEATTTECKENGAMNDLKWYVVSEQVLNDVARIPYSLPVGMAYSRDPRFQHLPSGSELLLSNYDSAVPGIFVSKIMPILGKATIADDPVNVAANSIYQYVRSKISGSRPYDAVDFMIYLGAMDSVFCLCTWLTRLYGTMYTYHGANRYLARALVEAQDVDYDDFRANLTQFRATFNQLIAKIKSLYVPSNMSIFVRHAWMFANYYIEGMSEKDQIYCHAPAGYYTFGLDSDKAGMLSAHPIHTNPKLKVTDVVNMLDDMITPIFDDEDFNRISGDLLKAYEGNVFTITEIPDIATVSLQYNEEVLLQFKNAKYMPVISYPDLGRFANNAFDYHQDYNKRYLEFVMPEASYDMIHKFTSTSNSTTIVTASSSDADKTMLASKFSDWSKDTLLTTPHNDVVPGENMINTRLTLGFDIQPDVTAIWSGKVNDLAVGTEWPLDYHIYCHRRDKSNGLTDLFQRSYSYSMYMDTSDYVSVRTAVMSQLPILESFKYHPELFITLIEYDVNTQTYYYRNAGRSIFELDNYATINFNALTGLHNAAILGQYNVPNLSVGK